MYDTFHPIIMVQWKMDPCNRIVNSSIKNPLNHDYERKDGRGILQLFFNLLHFFLHDALCQLWNMHHLEQVFLKMSHYETIILLMFVGFFDPDEIQLFHLHRPKVQFLGSFFQQDWWGKALHSRYPKAVRVPCLVRIWHIPLHCQQSLVFLWHQDRHNLHERYVWHTLMPCSCTRQCRLLSKQHKLLHH